MRYILHTRAIPSAGGGPAIAGSSAGDPPELEFVAPERGPNVDEVAFDGIVEGPPPGGPTGDVGSSATNGSVVGMSRSSSAL